MGVVRQARNDEDEEVCSSSTKKAGANTNHPADDLVLTAIPEETALARKAEVPAIFTAQKNARGTFREQAS